MTIYYFNEDINLEMRFDDNEGYDSYPDWNITVMGDDNGRYPI